MNFFRNSEIKKSFYLSLTATVLFSTAGFFFGLPFGLLLLLVCLFFSCFHFIFTYRRYHQISRLSQELDLILHGADTLHFSDYAEGELSILKIELDKLLLRLREQSDALKQDKLSLAASMADISHQIRTPLTSIHLVLSLLSEPQLTSERRMELVRQLSMLVSRIDWLIEALLKISRLDAGTVELKPQSLIMADIIRTAVEPLEIPMELREQHFSFAEKATGSLDTEKAASSMADHASDSTNKASVFCDLSWTVEAVANILKNCMEHTPPGGEIRAFVSENPIFSELIIEDNGSGFAKADLPHLFERFYKGENSSQQSIGIGLALARMILAQQNATIKAENRPQGGARFVIHFYKDLSK